MTAQADLEITVKITEKAQVAEDIYRFELTPVGDERLPAVEAGAHIDIEVPNGMIRKYSLCQEPDEEERYVIVVKREAQGKGGSKSLVDDTQIGDELRISSPVNDFPLTGKPARYLFIAGGIGITPIYSMTQSLIQTGGKPFKLYYFTRTPEQTAFLEEFQAPEYQGKVIIHHDEGDPDKIFNLWPVLEQQKGAYLYCCGPRQLMEDVKDMTGFWSGNSVHFEDFGKSDVAHQKDDKPFKVRIAGTDDLVNVPADKSILEALRKQGYDLPSSCESGTCGTCRCGLLEGDADHRDLVLTDEEHASNIMICVSRALSDELVLELPK